MFEAITNNGKEWESGQKWYARSLCQKFVVEGVLEDESFKVTKKLSSNAQVNMYGDNSYRHLWITEDDNGNTILASAHYRSNLPVNDVDENQSFLAYSIPNQDRYWAVIEEQVSDKDLVVLFKNAQTNGNWVAYQYHGYPVSSPAGKTKRSNLVYSKVNKGYSAIGSTLRGDLTSLY
ncbi:hypothetical protein [Shewanella aestuarii]|uniref:Uncharacterized protein n=1 Tax=Shewanella aestuarii TaxID=1028752 RepID=A0A6G9QQJ0_9GAMM|nr:hypothetical protein [Shewanella aestuarii]QIR16335.1 hypothetical protein HBH39_17775 [Shewanella aestuarii]